MLGRFKKNTERRKRILSPCNLVAKRGCQFTKAVQHWTIGKTATEVAFSQQTVYEQAVQHCSTDVLFASVDFLRI